MDYKRGCRRKVKEPQKPCRGLISLTGNPRGDYKEGIRKEKSLPGTRSGDVSASIIETAGNFPNISTPEPHWSRRSLAAVSPRNST